MCEYLHEFSRFQSEMEQQKEDGQTDYWLVQYQRLMDRKPQALMNQVSFISRMKIFSSFNSVDEFSGDFRIGYLQYYIFYIKCSIEKK